MTSPTVFVKTRLHEGATDRPTAATTYVVPSSSGWYWPAVRALDSFAALPVNWDGDGSDAPNPRELGVLSVIGSLQHPHIPEPDVVPGAGGSIALLWNHHGRRLELHFVAPDQLGALRVAPDGLVQESWSPPTPAQAQRHLDWLVTGRDWV